MNSSVRGGLVFVGIRGAAGLFGKGWGGIYFITVFVFQWHPRGTL